MVVFFVEVDEHENMSILLVVIIDFDGFRVLRFTGALSGFTLTPLSP